MVDTIPAGWYTRFLLERALAAIYLVAFLAAVNQFVPLLGERGLVPAPAFIRQVPFRYARASSTCRLRTPRSGRPAGRASRSRSSHSSDAAWLRTWAMSAAVWGALWLLYLSFVNVGQTFYGFGWESLLLETGFLTIFAGGSAEAPNAIVIWLWRWVLFRIMFGAGLIKMRGDPCWRDLTCLDYYFQTQPMPNPLSWYFHWLPRPVLHGGVVFNHFAELVVPFGYFLPQPIASAAGAITIVFQLVLIVSGNLSWLNWLTIVVAISTIDDRWLTWAASPPVTHAPGALHDYLVYGLLAVVGLLSISPTLNMLSPQQVMNTSFDPLQLVNTYGAFGSITKERDEIVIEGTSDERISDQTVWRDTSSRESPGIRCGGHPRWRRTICGSTG